MKSKKNNKKLPRYWLGTRKPTSLGYQQNYGIGNWLASTTPGEDINPEIKTVKSNMLPSALDKLQLHGSTAFNVLSNYTPGLAPMITGPITNAGAMSTSTAITSGAANYGLAARPVYTSVGQQLAQATGEVGGKAALNTANAAGSTAATGGVEGGKAAANSALGTAGTVLGAIGTLYGLGDMANQWLNQNEHRSIGQMRNTLAVNTYTTDMGNTYTQRGSINAGAEIDYARAAKRAKQLNFGATSIGTGLAAGATIGALAGSEVPLIGTAIGGAAGAIIGGLSAALGFGDTEEDVRKLMDLIADVTSMENRLSKTLADSEDVKQGFYSNRLSAAKGKLPKFAKGKVNARVSNGEVMIDFAKDGSIESASVVPGPVNSRTAFADGKKAHVGKNTGILSNQIIPGTGLTVAQYGLGTGDVAGAFTILDMINKSKYNKIKAKCGKLPGYWGGTPTQTILASVPHFGALLSNWKYANELKNASTYTPVEPITDLGAGNVAALVEGDMLDSYDYMKHANLTFREANWDASRNPNLGYGGREIAKANLFRNALDYQGDILTKIKEANRAQRNTGRELKFKNYLNMQNLMHDSWWKRENEMLAKQASLNNLRAQIPLNIYNIGSSWASNISDILQHKAATDLGWENARIYGWKTKLEADAQKALIENLGKWLEFVKKNPAAWQYQTPS